MKPSQIALLALRKNICEDLICLTAGMINCICLIKTILEKVDVSTKKLFSKRG
jgi:hypothetical protein